MSKKPREILIYLSMHVQGLKVEPNLQSTKGIMQIKITFNQRSYDTSPCTEPDDSPTVTRNHAATFMRHKKRTDMQNN